ncbi:MAG: ATP-binding cassette domain-containing protein [Halioglobus sp.]|nr:ATP-binding cassette domain-containing protein [Halioglobus sp.]
MADPGIPGAAPPGTQAQNDWQLLRRLTGYSTSLWYCLALSLAGFALYALGMVLLADLMQFLLDVVAGAEGGSLLQASVSAIAGADVPSRLAIPLALIALTLLRALGLFLGAFPLDWAARSLVFSLRDALFRQLTLARIPQLEAQDQGAQLSRLTYVAEQAALATVEAIKTLLREGLLLAGLFAYMLYLNWRLSLVILLVAPPIALMVRWAGTRFRRYSRDVQSSMADITQQAGDALRGQREMRAFGAGNVLRDRFRRVNRHNLHQSVKFAFAQALSTPAVQLLLAAGLALMLWFALGAGLLGSFSAGALAAYLTAAVQTGKPVRQLSAVQGALQRGLAATQEVFEQIDGAVEQDSGTHVVARARGTVDFERVSFTYPGAERPALSKISFSVPAGSTVGIVGRSGSGKSTLVDLLLRFIEPTEGEIMLDGVPLPAYTLENLRQQYSLVSQSATLFADTVCNNITMAATGTYSDAEIEAAARASHALPFIAELPLGLQTVLRNNGETLSGGERQRLALARALLKDAPVLVIDEGTAALDADTEARFRASLATHAGGRTTFVIAHRLATIESADQVLVLEGGRLVEQGSHHDLVGRSSRYQSLCQGELSSS